VHSRRPYSGLAELWQMIARSAYTQLRYSPLLLAGTVAGLCWLYLLPPAAVIGGLAAGLAGGGTAAWWCAGAGLAGWALMTASFVPVLRLYRLSPLRAPGLPVIALLYTAMTVDSARRHHAGRGGEWKGRAVPAGQPPGTIPVVTAQPPGTFQAAAEQPPGTGPAGTAAGPGREDRQPGVTAGGGQGDDG